MSACSVWPIDTDCCDLPEDVDPYLLAAKQEISSAMLRAASGLHVGICEVTVRPCATRCFEASSPFPYKGSDGAWRNFSACGCRTACSCTELSEIVLDGPVASVTQVLIDGDELMPENYRLDVVDGQARLVRLDGGTWPLCSDMTVDCDADGAFCVTYEQGIEPDALAIAANSELTCELVKACIPNCKTCRLPKNVQAVVRRGVSITFDNSVAWLKQLPMVNAFITATNPAGLTSPSSVWWPERGTVRTTPLPSGS